MIVGIVGSEAAKFTPITEARAKHQHVKSGGCWTAKYAQSLGKPAFWEVIA